MEPNLFVWGTTILMLADHQLLWLGVQILSWDKTRDLTSISIWERDEKDQKSNRILAGKAQPPLYGAVKQMPVGDPVRGS